MTDEEIPEYSRTEKARIARIAKRNVYSECTLILGAGFAVLVIVFFWFAKFTFLPISVATGLNPNFVLVALSFVTAAIWSWLHFMWFRPIISRARDMDAAFLYQYQNKLRRQREPKGQENIDDD